jgi:hypothetical protein
MVKFSLFVVFGTRDWALAMTAGLAGMMRAVSNGSRNLPNAGAYLQATALGSTGLLVFRCER